MCMCIVYLCMYLPRLNIKFRENESAILEEDHDGHERNICVASAMVLQMSVKMVRVMVLLPGRTSSESNTPESSSFSSSFSWCGVWWVVLVVNKKKLGEKIKNTIFPCLNSICFNLMCVCVCVYQLCACACAVVCGVWQLCVCNNCVWQLWACVCECKTILICPIVAVVKKSTHNTFRHKLYAYATQNGYKDSECKGTYMDIRGICLQLDKHIIHISDIFVYLSARFFFIFHFDYIFSRLGPSLSITKARHCTTNDQATCK